MFVVVSHCGALPHWEYSKVWQPFASLWKGEMPVSEWEEA